MYFPSSKTDNWKDFFLQRTFEIIPGALVWVTLVGIISLSFFAPFAAAVIIIIFDLFWFINALRTSIYLINGYRAMKKFEKIKWLEKLKLMRGWQSIYHLIILPTYNENVEILRFSLSSLTETDYPKDKMIVVLAIEERAGNSAIKKAKILEEEFGDKFFKYFTTIHPADIPGEAKVKGANVSWAAKCSREFLDQAKISYEKVIVSTFDCDTRSHQQYFSCLAFHYLKEPKPTRASYQPLDLFFNNIWEVSVFTRILILGSSFWNFVQNMRPERIVTFSSHSMSFATLVEIDYWPPDMISDDSIIFWKCYISFDGDYKVVPINLPVFMDAVQAPTTFETIVNQYKQYRRWAYGVENIPLIARGFLKNKKILLKEKIVRLFFEFFGRYNWATAPFIITFLGWLPLFFGPEKFQKSILALNLPQILQNLMTLAMVGLFLSTILTLLLLPPLPRKFSRLKYLEMIAQWVLVPVLAIPLGALPAVDAQTRLMSGKYMEFFVTPKYRKTFK